MLSVTCLLVEFNLPRMEVVDERSRPPSLIRESNIEHDERNDIEMVV